MIVRPTSLHIDAMYRTDFASFIAKCFLTLHPGKPFYMNWHILSMAYQLEQVRLGRINRLIINMPPRSLKSIVSSVAYPAWLLGHDPSKLIVAVSYSKDLAIKHHNDFRKIMGATFYQRAFATRISRTKNTELEVETTLGGGRLATSIDGTLTGRGGDLVVLDDPLKSIDALSNLKREKPNSWYYKTLVSRLNDKVNGAILLVMQRLHMNDLTGTVLCGSEQWTKLVLSAIAELDEDILIGPNKYHTRRFGEALHQEREPLSFLEMMRSQQGADTFSAQYQQHPTPPGGALIKRAWVRRYDQLPASDASSQILQSWDTASKEGGENDYSACATVLIHNNQYYLVDVMRGRYNYPTLKSLAMGHARAYNANKILIEDTGVGTALIAEMQSAGFSAIAVKPEHDKLTRMSIQSAKIEGGQWFLPSHATWLAEFETEFFSFPMAGHDDQIDAISQALGHQLSAYGWNERNLKGLASFTSSLCGGW
jgi:predicted phage terminase large subunit-like protein